MENNNESKIRKVLFNEVFLIVTILAAISTPVYAFFNINTEIKLLNSVMARVEKRLEKDIEWRRAILGKISIMERDIVLIQAGIKNNVK